MKSGAVHWPVVGCQYDWERAGAGARASGRHGANHRAIILSAGPKCLYLTPGALRAARQVGPEVPRRSRSCGHATRSKQRPLSEREYCWALEQQTRLGPHSSHPHYQVQGKLAWPPHIRQQASACTSSLQGLNPPPSKRFVAPEKPTAKTPQPSGQFENHQHVALDRRASPYETCSTLSIG